MADAQLAGDVTRSDAEPGQFDDSHPGAVGQRPPIDEHSAELVHFAVLLGLVFWIMGERKRRTLIRNVTRITS